MMEGDLNNMGVIKLSAPPNFFSKIRRG